MNNQVNRIITFSTAIRLLREARQAIQENLVGNYRSIIEATNSNNKIIIFVDCDEATDHRTGTVRKQLFEAARLFKNYGGMIYALSSHDFPFFQNGNSRNFTRVFLNLDLDRKTRAILNIISNEENDNRKLLIFGSGDLLASVLTAARPGDVLADVSGTQIMDDNEEPIQSIMQSYRVVDYILFYLAVKLLLRRMEHDGQP